MFENNRKSLKRWSYYSLGLLLIFLSMQRISAQTFSCHSTCSQCFGSGSNQCTKCVSASARLIDFTCVVTSTCPTTRPIYDTSDKICKNTIYDTDYPCPHGTYNPDTGQIDSASCKPCDSGNYCPYRGSGDKTGLCAPGFYCTTSSSFYKPHPDLATYANFFLTSYGGFCAPGTYCPQGTPAAQDCDPGMFCPEYLMTEPTQKCSPGYFCKSKATVATPIDGTTGNVCPAGKFCPEGSSNAQQCPEGTYLSYTGALSSQECLQCTAGFYCQGLGLSTPTGKCADGYYCPEGSTTSKAAECPIGSFCASSTETGATQPQVCPAGQYNSKTASTTCQDCGIGKYCQENFFDMPCEMGHYCPGKNRLIQCPIGKFNNKTDSSLITDCTSCAPGFSCETTGIRALSKQCDAGFICTGGSLTPKPSNVTNKLQQGGRMCVPGELCSRGQSVPTQCSGGRYCKEYAASMDTGNCEAGYYCPDNDPQTVKNPSKYKCPPGYYCPEGSKKEIPCPAGTYSPSLGATSVTNCLPCPPGFVCSGSSLQSSSSTACAEGYYCPAGIKENMQAQYKCNPGYECPAGSTDQTECAPGTYQPEAGQASCLQCPAGSYCDGISRTVTLPCPKGYYCLAGTKFATQYPCPPGTFNPSESKGLSTDCVKINKGYWNDEWGVSDETAKKIQKGTYALQTGQLTPKQTPCPMYHYCPEGTVTPIPCENGFITLGEGAGDIQNCVKCPRGNYCRFGDFFKNNAFTVTNLKSVSNNLQYFGKCLAGYVCKEGSNIMNPNDNIMGYICPQGAYCPTGTTFEIQCSPGTYNDIPGQTSSCFNCPAGKICPLVNMITPDNCQPGHYCPQGSVRAVPCPPGTYNTAINAQSLSQCLACPPGQFCDSWGLQASTGTCQDGFICVGGSSTATPYVNIYTTESKVNGRCPVGHFCLAGDLEPRKCPEGTYNPNTGQTTCEKCPRGQYCKGSGLDKPTGLCFEGFICEEGSTTPNPKKSVKGDLYYPIGGVMGVNCQDGYYLTDEGYCKLCNTGQKCTSNNIQPCDKAKYCDNPGLTPYGLLCPNGTYSEMTGLKSSSQCTTCPAGKFCVAGKLGDDCNAGYICLFGADSPTPHKRLGAYACPKGFYCSKGVSQPVICPLGKFTIIPGAIQEEECDFCQEGYYCEYGAIEATPCPEGNYCPIGSQEPINCTVTRYNPNELGTNIESCEPCKGGYFCNEDALGNLFKYGDEFKCPAGSYCPPATWIPFKCMAGTFSDTAMNRMPSSLGDCGVCPQHHFCPMGTDRRFKHPCQAGTYCPAGSTWPLQCPPGKYCEHQIQNGQNLIIFQDCPENFYCPLGTKRPIPCNLAKGDICKKGSSFPTRTVLTSTICKPGQYFGYGMCNDCEAGFVCQNNTSVKYPVFLSTEGGYECPPGNYCPRGSSAPIKCPKGTFRKEKKASKLADCLQCPSDSFNDQEGQISCTKCGRGAIGNSESGLTNCVCIGQFRQWRASDNQCICQTGFYEPILPTVEGRTSTDIQDCKPSVRQECQPNFHYDTNVQSCVSNTVCQNASLCNGQGSSQGFYSESAMKCLCRNLGSSPESFCDSICRNQSLKAFLMSNGQICLQAGNNRKCYQKSEFGNNLLLEGVECPVSQGQCEITNMRNENGIMKGSFEAQEIFVQKWKQNYPNYKSPYSSTSQGTISVNSTSKRLLQTTSPKYIESTIICTRPSYPVSFEVSRDHFPVYLKDSLYNTNDNFDDGFFDLLKIKLVQANMTFTSLMYSFLDEGVYVFADSSNLNLQSTIVKVSRTLCAPSSNTANIFPITEDNLKKFNIVPREVQLERLPQSLIIVPIAFIVLTFVSTLVQYLWELKIEREEYEVRMKRAGKRRNFHNIDGKLDKRQYLADLYKLIKDNMDEVKRMINAHDNKINLLKLLKDKTSLINELGDGGKETVDDLKNQLKTLLEQLRFPDGSTLKDQVEQKRMQKEFQKKLNQKVEGQEDEDDAHDDLLDEDLENLDRHTVTASQLDSDEDDNEDDSLVDALSQNFKIDLLDQRSPHQDDQENNHKDDNKDEHQRDLDVERQLKLRRERERRKADFKDKIGDLLDSNNNNDQGILDVFDDKMRSLDQILKSEMDRQNEALRAKLLSQRRRKREALQHVTQVIEDKQDQIARLQSERNELEQEKQDVLDSGMSDPQLLQIAEREKQQVRDDFEKATREKEDIIRKEYMSRLKNAKNDKEKERILEEMNRRLKNMQEESERERAEQERNLEKILIARQQKRVKKLAHDHQKEIDRKSQQIEGMQSEIDKDKAKAFADFGGDIPELLDDSCKDKVSRLVAKSLLSQTQTQALELDKRDLEALEIMKVQQKIEKDQALNAVDKEIEDSAELDKLRMEEDLKNKFQKQKDDFAVQISQAKSEKERKRLIDEARNLDKRLEDELSNERLRQDRLLEEKKKNRKGLRKVKEIELEQKHMEEQAKKETEMLQKKYDKLMNEHTQTFDKDMAQAVKSFEKQGHTDRALLLVNQASNEMLEKKLRILINKQFFELEKYLGTLYNQMALQRISAKEKSRARFKQAEEEAYAKGLTGETLVSRLEQIKDLEKIENESIESNFRLHEKEEETKIRERLETKFYEEKRATMLDDQKHREKLLKEIMDRHNSQDPNSSQAISNLAQSLLNANEDRSAKDLEQMEADKEQQLERIKLQIIADNEAEVQQLQKSIEEQLQKEKEQVETRMKQKRDEIMGERKRKLEERIKEMSGQISADQKELIMQQFLKELSALEKAIEQERDAQLRKMRQRLIKRKIEQERLKKEEQQHGRVKELKKQIGKYLMGAIQQARTNANQLRSTSVPKNKQQANKPVSSQGKRGTQAEKQAIEISTYNSHGTKDLRLLLEQWKERVNDQHSSNADSQNIWERNTANVKQSDSPRSSVSKMSKVTGLQGLKGPGAFGGGGLNTSIMTAQTNNYTMEELMRRVRRIEKLTDRMSHGQFESKRLAQQVIAGAQDGSLPLVLTSQKKL